MRLDQGVAIVVVSLVLLACAGRSDGPKIGDLHGIVVQPAIAKPDFQMAATDGRMFDFRRETYGQLTLLFFGYTHCPDICPVQVANVAAALRRLSPMDAQRVRVVFVTTDPQRDTPERLRAWLDNFDHSFVGLRGSEREVNLVESAVGVPLSAKSGTDSTYDVGHAALVLAFTQDDSLRAMYPFGTRQQDWAADLPVLLAAGRAPRGNAGASAQ